MKLKTLLRLIRKLTFFAALAVKASVSRACLKLCRLIHGTGSHAVDFHLQLAHTGHIYRAKPKEKWARLGHKELDRLSHAISETHKLASVEALPSRLISAFVKSFSQFSGDTADDENGFSRRRIKLSCILVDFGNHAWRYTDTPQQSMSCDLRASVYKAIQQYISATETGSTSLHTSENVHSASLHSQHPFDHCQVTLHIVRANITDPELLPKDIVQQLSKEITISIVNIPNIPSKVENYLFDFFSGQLSLKRLKITAEAPKQKENAYVMCRTFHNRTLKLPLHVDQYVRKSARLAPQFQPYADDLKEIYILEDVTESSVSDMVNLSGATLSSTEPVPKWEMADAPVLGPTTVTLLEIEGKIFLTETSKYNGILSEGQDGHTLKVNATDQTVSSRQDVATLTNEFRWAICFRDGCLAPIASLGSIDDNPEQAVCGYGIESGKVLTLLEKFQHIMTKSNIPNLNPAFETLNQLLAVLILAREGNEVPDLPMPSEGDSKPAMAARLLGGLVKVAAEYEHDSGMHAKLCQFITSYLTERKYNWDEDEAETSDGDNTGSINKAWRGQEEYDYMTDRERMDLYTSKPKQSQNGRKGRKRNEQVAIKQYPDISCAKPWLTPMHVTVTGLAREKIAADASLGKPDSALRHYWSSRLQTNLELTDRDLFGVEADKEHGRKRKREFDGRLPVQNRAAF